LTTAQQRALDELWPRFGIGDATGTIDTNELFGRNADVVIEIGFGNGESLWQMARSEPDTDFIGIEVHKPGVGHLLLALEEHLITNVRIAATDAVTFLQQRVAPGNLAGARIYFPDPWPKKRHHKRRLIQPDFVDLLARLIKPDGVLHLATDWQPYAQHMREVLLANHKFVNLSPNRAFCERPHWRPYTKYEKRAERLGHNVYDLLFARC